MSVIIEVCIGVAGVLIGAGLVTVGFAMTLQSVDHIKLALRVFG